jgi:hypothetical protein
MVRIEGTVASAIDDEDDDEGRGRFGTGVGAKTSERLQGGNPRLNGAKLRSLWVVSPPRRLKVGHSVVFHLGREARRRGACREQAGTARLQSVRRPALPWSLDVSRKLAFRK